MILYFRIYLLDAFKPFVVIDLRDVRFIPDVLAISYQCQVDNLISTHEFNYTNIEPVQ